MQLQLRNHYEPQKRAAVINEEKCTNSFPRLLRFLVRPVMINKQTFQTIGVKSRISVGLVAHTDRHMVFYRPHKLLSRQIHSMYLLVNDTFCSTTVYKWVC